MGMERIAQCQHTEDRFESARNEFSGIDTESVGRNALNWPRGSQGFSIIPAELRAPDGRAASGATLSFGVSPP